MSAATRPRPSKNPPAAIRPKQRRLYQYPLQPEAVLTRAQSLALLVPQALLMIGVWTWWRRRRL